MAKIRASQNFIWLATGNLHVITGAGDCKRSWRYRASSGGNVYGSRCKSLRRDFTASFQIKWEGGERKRADAQHRRSAIRRSGFRALVEQRAQFTGMSLIGWRFTSPPGDHHDVVKCIHLRWLLDQYQIPGKYDVFIRFFNISRTTLTGKIPGTKDTAARIIKNTSLPGRVAGRHESLAERLPLHLLSCETQDRNGFVKGLNIKVSLAQSMPAADREFRTVL
jgi:hypothetical protein